MFNYRGSKTKELPRIIEKSPKGCNCFVDVFGGSGCVAFRLSSLYDKVVFNEVNSSPPRFLEFLKKEENIIKLIKAVEGITNERAKSIFDSYLAKTKNGIHCNALEIFIYHQLNFRCQHTEVCYYPNIKRLPAYTKKLLGMVETAKKIMVENRDYKEILAKFKEDELAFLYLDPPYLAETKTKGSYYANIREFTLDDYEFLVDYMRTAKCKCMLNIEYTAYAREELSHDLHIHTYKHTFASRCNNKGRTRYPHYQLMFTNYEL